MMTIRQALYRLVRATFREEAPERRLLAVLDAVEALEREEKGAQAVMTPLEIEILLHCHRSSGTAPSNADSPAVLDAIEFFLNDSLIEGCKDYYSTTERGTAFVRVLCSVALPEQKGG